MARKRRKPSARKHPSEVVRIAPLDQVQEAKEDPQLPDIRSSLKVHASNTPAIGVLQADDNQSQSIVIIDSEMMVGVEGVVVTTGDVIEDMAALVQRIRYDYKRVDFLVKLGHKCEEADRVSEAGQYLYQAAQLSEKMDPTSEAVGPIIRCRAFENYGYFLLRHQRTKEAEPYLTRAADLADGLRTATGSVTSDESRDVPELLARTRFHAYFQHAQLLATTGSPLEAEPHLRQAAEMVDRMDDSLSELKCFAYRGIGFVYSNMKQYGTAVKYYRLAQLELAWWLTDECSSPHHIVAKLRDHSGIFEEGLRSQGRRYENGELSWKDHSQLVGTEFLDGNKAFWVREALHRHAHQPSPPSVGTWVADEEEWAIRVSRPIGSLSGIRRGRRCTDESGRLPVCVVELPDDPKPAERPVVGPLLSDELTAWLSASPAGYPNTVYVLFDFVNYDLYVVPVRRGPDGQPTELLAPNGYFVIEGVWHEINRLTKQWSQALSVVGVAPAVGSTDTTEQDLPEPLVTLGTSADNLREQLDRLTGYGTDNPVTELEPLVCEWPPRSGPTDDYPRPPASLMVELGRVMQLDQLLDHIEPDPGKWETLHLVLLPDVQLYQLPLHAAWVRLSRRPLLDAVGSVRYGLSLRTLHTLEQIEDRQSTRFEGPVPLRGALFANPTGISGEYRFGDDISGVAEEVGNVVAASGANRWQVFGDLTSDPSDLGRYASRDNMRTALSDATVVWAACHGGTALDELEGVGQIDSPGLFLCDAPLTAARIVADKYDFRGCWLFHASCCLLAQLKSEDADRQAEGFFAALAVRGCRRMSGAMWWLADAAAAEFASHYAAALRRNVFDASNREPNAFAVSLKEAVKALRQSADGRFDHEIFWAPYLLYGLG